MCDSRKPDVAGLRAAPCLREALVASLGRAIDAMKLGLLIDLDNLRSAATRARPRARMERRVRDQRAAHRLRSYGSDPWACGSNGPPLRGRRVSGFEDGELPDVVPALREAACVTVCPTGASYKREDGIVLVDQDRCMGSICALGLPVRRARAGRGERHSEEMHACVDRVHDERLPEHERQPACVLACPTHARHYGDLRP